MPHGETGPTPPDRPGATNGHHRAGPALADLSEPTGQVIETIVSPFHCLYQDALWLHTQSRLRLPRSESESGRLARAAMLLYLQSAEALVHQASVELGRPELSRMAADPSRPLPLAEAWALLPAIAADGPAPALDPSCPPWPQFAELLALRDSWAYPGPASSRRAYYRSSADGSGFEPIDPRRIPSGLDLPPDRLSYPLTGLPRDPYALRPDHLDTARGVLDQAIAALDRRLGGELTREGRHRKEPVRLVVPNPPAGPD